MERKWVMERVTISRLMVGLIGMQVCAIASATDQEILAVCNLFNPSGTAAGWNQVVRTLKDDDAFCTKENLPVPCEDDPERLHFLVLC